MLVGTCERANQNKSVKQNYRHQTNAPGVMTIPKS